MQQNALELGNGLVAAVREAGTVLMSYYHTDLRRQYKDHGRSFATSADLASEQLLIERLRVLVPDASFYAEESGRFGTSTDGYCWVIDPLDGTTNFAQGLPYFCISVALTHQGVPQVGVVYQPLLGELFYAQRGKGAWLNDVPIHVNSQQELGTTLWVIGLPYQKNHVYMKLLDALKRLAPHMYAFRHFGAAALDCAYVACGRLNGVFLVNLSWWDVAAGMLLIQEAGGIVTDFSGKPITASYESFIAGNATVHKQLSDLIASLGNAS